MFFSVLFVGDDDYEVEEGAKKSVWFLFVLFSANHQVWFVFIKSSGLFFCFCEILSMMMLWGHICCQINSSSGSDGYNIESGQQSWQSPMLLMLLFFVLYILFVFCW